MPFSINAIPTVSRMYSRTHALPLKGHGQVDAMLSFPPGKKGIYTAFTMFSFQMGLLSLASLAAFT